VASSRDTSTRRKVLEQILAETTPAASGTEIADADAAHAHLSSVPLERIRRLTAAVHESPSSNPDEIDAMAMRLLLDEYKTAVAHLRAVANEAASHVDGAGALSRQARVTAHRYRKSVTSRGATGKGRQGSGQ
jgi:hypothetical protein